MNAFFKDVLREIKCSFGRYISIFSIVALGCGFFAGVKATCPDMQMSAHNYFVSSNLMDVSLVSSYGVTKDDAHIINNLDCVTAVMPAYSKDVIYNVSDDSIVIRLFSYNPTLDDSSPYKMNIPNLKEGRLPENPGEIALETHDMTSGQFEIGDVITLEAPVGEVLSDSIKYSEYTIVGIIDLPMYIGFTRDTTTVGNGKVNTNAVICEGDFSFEYYTQMFVTVEGAKDLDPFSEEYREHIDEAMIDIEAAFSECVNDRYSDIVASVESKIKNGEESIEFINYLLSIDDVNALLDIKNEKEADLQKLRSQYEKAVEENNPFKSVYRSKVLQSESMLEQLDSLIYAKTENDQEIIASFQKNVDESVAQINEAKITLQSLEEPVFFNTLRKDYTDIASFKTDSERIDSIARVFPVFFIIVAALVCLTTMTRMIEEQRTVIGTYKALGYSSFAICSKYLIYALSAAVFGGLFGMAIGFKLFPIIVFECYKLLYNMEAIQAPFRWDYAILCLLVTMALVTITVIYACISELRSVPSSLMRPKPPRTGKRVFLENISFIWNRMSFLSKVTVRNLFRYKKRFLMTVIGVAGCTALIITGFGLKTSIASMVDVQFEEIFVYDGIVLPVDGDSHGIEKENAILQNNENVDSYMNLLQATIDTYNGDNTVNAVYLMVPESFDNFSNYIILKDDNGSIRVSEDGVVISEKLSILLDCKVGDKIEIKLPDGYPVEVKVTGIAECYALHYVYMTGDFYQTCFKQMPQPSATLVNFKDGIDENKLVENLLLEDDILAVSVSSDTAQSFIDMIKSLNLIVIVLIVCAAALAFVVLYNLGNINITERIREIATIKVLGFYDGETSSYIFRESYISSFIGILVGWVMGAVLHRFVVITAEVDLVMFERSLKLSDVLVSSILTAIFTIIVNVALHHKLKSVNMVESMKAVE